MSDLPTLNHLLESLRGCDGVRSDMHTILQFFHYAHLPARLQPSAKVLADAAVAIAMGPRNPERTVALRKLLEAKDAAVRAHVYSAGA